MSVRRNVFSWIALLAILAVTFAPSLTGALAASRGLPWDAVCSATASIDGAGGSSNGGTPGDSHTFAHCPYCALHADLAPPPDVRQLDGGVAFAYRAAPAAFLRAPRANPVWSAGQARAPPRFA